MIATDWRGQLLASAGLLDRVPAGRLDLRVLVALHRLLLSPAHPYWGRLRDRAGVIRLDGAVHRELPPPDEARRMVARALRWLAANVGSEDGLANPVVVAAEIAYLLAEAHPFVDGNGRVARAVASWLLIRAGYRPVLDPRAYCRDRRAALYEALARRQGLRPPAPDPRLWHTFFSGMVEACFERVGGA